MDVLIVILFSYLSGSIPFGLILTKIFGNQDIRNIGLMGAIHFGSEDGKTAVEVASKVFKFCYENNVLVRFSGEFIVLSPALIVEEEQIKLIIETIRQGIQSLN
jgi:adenosylmethionine-8-amino-7-oxononanoate aminotransferase